jgi:mRNA interferase HicA
MVKPRMRGRSSRLFLYETRLRIDRVTTNGYCWVVKASELRRWLRKHGCTLVEESRHTRIVLGSRVSRMPRHPAKEIKTGTLQSILKDLDLKM